MGVVESRWAPRSSKSVAGRYASRGGFDSHSLPLFSSLTKILWIRMDLGLKSRYKLKFSLN